MSATDSTEASPDGRRHLPVLDGVRGLAILLVLIHHFTPEGLIRPDATFSLYRWLHLGWTGVDLFFVLSGFLITGILVDARSSPHYYRNFYARRALRIFPLYYGALFLLFVVVPLTLSVGNLWGVARKLLGEHFASYEQVRANQLWLWLYLSNVVTALTGQEWYVAGHFWSLAVEEHFYLVWPLVIRVFPLRWLPVACLGVAMGSLALRVVMLAAGVDAHTLYVLTPCRLDGLALGGWLALAARGSWGLDSLARHTWWVALGCAAALAVGFAVQGSPGRGSPFLATAGFFLLALLFGSLLLHALTAPATSWTGRLFRSTVLCQLGKYSYGLYVLHRLLLMPLRKLLPPEYLADVTGSLGLGLLAFQVVALAASVAVAWLSWHLYEKHFLKLKRYFES
jgi:peptidoglycan/LPS O-acetylase OafA/YrhL